MLEFFKTHRPKLLFGILFMSALLVYSHNLRQRNHTSLFEMAVIQLTAPIFQAVENTSSDLQRLWDNYINLVDVRRRNLLLQQQLIEQRRQLLALREIAQENIRLKKLLKFHDNLGTTTVPARIIAEDAAAWFRTVTINKGRDDGIREGLPVVVAEGVVGRVIKCAPHNARVLLSVDAASEIAALVQRNRTRGICRGMGTAMSFDYALRDRDIKPGDNVVTSGTGGIFPKGLPLGTVTAVVKHNYGLFQTLTITPSVDFSRLEDVLVIIPEQS